MQEQLFAQVVLNLKEIDNMPNCQAFRIQELFH